MTGISCWGGLLYGAVWFFFSVASGHGTGQPTVVPTGAGTNRCQLILNFSAGERVVFQHRWNGTSLNAKALLEAVINATGGELLVTDGYLTPFSPALLLLTNPGSTGLVVHYQNSYSVPFLNGIRWGGPSGPVGADYELPDGWWHLWVSGPAHVDQSFAWPDPLPPLDLGPSSGWFFGEFSGLADLTLSDGASVGLVYGSALPPSLPAPKIRSVIPSIGSTLQIEFTSVPGMRYQLETCPDLVAAAWIPWGDILVATADTTTVTTPADSAAGRGFYRVGLLP